MRNIKLTLEYDGTGYQGWQVQPHGPSVQGAVISAIGQLTGGEEVRLTGASRTDSGVHARGQVANFSTSSALPVVVFQRGLNALLPPDIAVVHAEEVDDAFDARRGASYKRYVYSVLARPFPSPLLRRFSWHVPRSLDVEAMREGAAFFIGEKDFTSFRAAGSDAPHSVREVFSVDIAKAGGGLIVIEVKGRAFLRHMVRIMAGTLVEVGLGRMRPERVGEIIEARDRSAAPRTAPARGLCLEEVVYE